MLCKTGRNDLITALSIEKCSLEKKSALLEYQECVLWYHLLTPFSLSTLYVPSATLFFMKNLLSHAICTLKHFLWCTQQSVCFLFSFKNSTRRNGIICSRREFTRSSRGLKMSVVSDNLAKKAMEFSLLTSAYPNFPRDDMLRQKRGELAAMAKKWMNYIAFSSLCYSSQSSLNVNTLKERLFVKTDWQNTQKENIGLCSVNFFLYPIYIYTHAQLLNLSFQYVT